MSESPSRVDLALLAVTVAAVSTSAPLIRAAAAPALAVAMWRTVLVLPVLAPAAAYDRRPVRRGGPGPLTRRERRGIVLAGLFLAAHFATWVPSLSFTSVASAAALVATQPVWAAMIARARGESVPAMVWVGIGLALGGVAALTGVDLTLSTRALFGDALALVGGMLAAAYVTVGADVRRTVSTSTYSSLCYAVAGVVLLAVSLVAGQPLTGYSATTWGWLVALAFGPQLLGHTVMNRVLRTVDPTLASVAILFEIVGAAAIAWVAFDESPPLAAVPAAALIAAGVLLVLRAGRTSIAVGSIE